MAAILEFNSTGPNYFSKINLSKFIHNRVYFQTGFCLGKIGLLSIFIAGEEYLLRSVTTNLCFIGRVV